MIEHEAVRVITDHHQFLLVDGDGSGLSDAYLPEDDAIVLGESGQISVHTGAYAAPVEVSIHELDEEPAASAGEWEDVVEFSVRCAQRIAIAELFGAPRATVISRPGWHRVRVSARGRDAGEARGEVGARAAVVEHYLIQTWPAPATDGVTVRTTSLQPVDHAAGRVHLAAARAAAARIDLDLDGSAGHRDLTGATGTATAHWTYPASARKLFRYMAMPNLWTSAMCGGSNVPEPGARYWLARNTYRAIWDGIPTSSRGCLEGTVVELVRPRLAVSTWQWLGGRRHDSVEPVLAGPTTVTMRLAQTRDKDGPRTTVQVAHSDLPGEWVDDMTTIWLCKFEAGVNVFPIHR